MTEQQALSLYQALQGITGDDATVLAAINAVDTTKRPQLISSAYLLGWGTEKGILARMEAILASGQAPIELKSLFKMVDTMLSRDGAYIDLADTSHQKLLVALQQSGAVLPEEAVELQLKAFGTPAIGIIGRAATQEDVDIARMIGEAHETFVAAVESARQQYQQVLTTTF